MFWYLYFSLSEHSLNDLYIHFFVIESCTSQVDVSIFVGIEIGQSLAVEDPNGDFTVTAVDANHCPGLSSLFSLNYHKSIPCFCEFVTEYFGRMLFDGLTTDPSFCSCSIK